MLVTLSVVKDCHKLINFPHGITNDVCGANANSRNAEFEANGPDKKRKGGGKTPDTGNTVTQFVFNQSLRTLRYKLTFTPDSHATASRVTIALKRCHTDVLPFKMNKISACVSNICTSPCLY